MRSAARSLVRSAHPVPAAAVTTTAVVMGAVAQNRLGTCALLGCAVLAGQLSVGWSNDRIDARRDRLVDHPGKPLVTGETSPRAVGIASAVAGTAVIPLSLLLGWRAGALHLAAVAAAWCYNGWLKRTWLSWLPYTLAFGALPAVATLALPSHPSAASWVIAATALIGTAVNFVNAVPVLVEHPASDVHGLPDRLGGRFSLVIAAALLTTSGAVIAVSPREAPTPISWLELALTLIGVTAGTAALWRDADTRRPFHGLVALAAVQLLAAIITGAPLH